MHFTEQELKVFLKKEQYDRLIDGYATGKSIRQVNYYFDTATSALLKRGSTMRIREKESGLKLH